MFEIQEMNESSMRLESAILIYKINGNQAFATKHPVEPHKKTGTPVIKPGSPFTESDYMELVKGLAPKDRPATSWFDERILASGNGRLIWWNPPRKRSMFFKAAPGRMDSFDGKAVCPVPGLIFSISNSGLHLFSFKGDARPTQKTPLFRAPFYNVWESNRVCEGNAVKPEDFENLDGWEDMFFGSNFTHTNIQTKDQLTRGVNPRVFWKKMVENPSQKFPERVLVPLKLNAGDLLEEKNNDE